MNDLTKNLLLWVVVAVVLMVVFQSFASRMGAGATQQAAAYSQFLDQVDNSSIQKISFSDDNHADVTKITYHLANGEQALPLVRVLVFFSARLRARRTRSACALAQRLEQ